MCVVVPIACSCSRVVVVMVVGVVMGLFVMATGRGQLHYHGKHHYLSTAELHAGLVLPQLSLVQLQLGFC